MSEEFSDYKCTVTKAGHKRYYGLDKRDNVWTRLDDAEGRKGLKAKRECELKEDPFEQVRTFEELKAAMRLFLQGKVLDHPWHAAAVDAETVPLLGDLDHHVVTLEGQSNEMTWTPKTGGFEAKRAYFTALCQPEVLYKLLDSKDPRIQIIWVKHDDYGETPGIAKLAQRGNKGWVLPLNLDYTYKAGYRWYTNVPLGKAGMLRSVKYDVMKAGLDEMPHAKFLKDLAFIQVVTTILGPGMNLEKTVLEILERKPK